MEAWITFSIVAAAFQTVRFMLQKYLSMGQLSAGGATFSRFLYSAPIITALMVGYLIYRGETMPSLSVTFWTGSLIGGFGQVAATWCVVALFAQRNFAVGITFKKTEVIQTALFGLVILGDQISTVGWVAIIVGLVGVLVLSDPPSGEGALIGRVWNKAASLGIISGALFAISAIGYRAATLEIDSEDPLMRSSVTLCVVTLSQTVGMAVWLAWREEGEVGRVLGVWRTAIWMGLTGMLGSIFWFTAFTLQNAAYVFAVGQIEVIFSLAASYLFFKEKMATRELVGIFFLSGSILGLILLS